MKNLDRHETSIGASTGAGAGAGQRFNLKQRTAPPDRGR